jgi:Flp pilus assembly protein TadB
MAAFIILQAAARRNREHWDEINKEKEKHAKEMIAKGYRRELVLQNPNSRYHHSYRKISKQNVGTLFIAISLSGLCSIFTTLFVLGSLSAYWFIPIGAFIIMLIMGGNKFNNETTDWSQEVIAPEKPGHYLLKTSDEARYDYEWIKKENANGKRK